MAAKRFATSNSAEPMLGADDAANLVTEFTALLADVTAIRTALVATTAKLNADSGTSDTDYDTNDPAALTCDGLFTP